MTDALNTNGTLKLFTVNERRSAVRAMWRGYEDGRAKPHVPPSLKRAGKYQITYIQGFREGLKDWADTVYWP